MTTAQLSDWQQLSLRYAERRFGTEIAQVVAGMVAADVPKLSTLLRSAVVTGDRIPSETLHALVALSFDKVLTIGAGPGFSEYAQFFDSALLIIEELRRRGSSTTSLWLAAARFEARLANGSPRRRKLIEQAAEASLNDVERVHALLTLAKYHTDVSAYGRARRRLDECRRLLTADAPSEYVVDVETATGISYYYADTEAAERYFDRAVELGQPVLGERGVRQAVATAVHYLGRLAHDHGDLRSALHLYVGAEHLSDNMLTGQGFFHQRLAEVLVAHGTVEQARYHIEQANAIFTQAGEVSIAVAVLRGTWVRFYVRLGEFDHAERTGVDGLKISHDHIGPRAELVLLAELFMLQLRRRRWLGLVPLALRGGWLFFWTETTGGVHRLPRQLMTVVRRLAPMVRLRRRETGSREVLECPCGAGH
ncbi:tetratricopeptide repeat protein [Kutzneria buriramensis]|uniref:MalT-like TPR region domain-containing protein n=1 Tax=Kutzneria buriramensis TaxID=1045776 RepID=A0A3E0HL67_9PSEU|nr:tetratricopeptide repeat protein [Kutzneria buriramensis]REH47118.1 hypothetical protein BCF44_106283 [Kutzneria buriramensis]